MDELICLLVDTDAVSAECAMSFSAFFLSFGGVVHNRTCLKVCVWFAVLYLAVATVLSSGEGRHDLIKTSTLGFWTSKLHLACFVMQWCPVLFYHSLSLERI